MSPFALVDIGSTSVGAALVRYDRSKNGVVSRCPEILFSTRNEIALQDDLDSKRFLSGIELALKKTLADVVQSGHGAPARVACFLSAPFYAAHTRVVKHESATPFAPSESLLADLLKKDLAELDRAHHEVLEQKVMQIKLNGYVVPKLTHDRVTSLEAVYFTSLVPSSLLQRFRTVARGAFHHSRVECHSFSSAFYSVAHGLEHVGRESLLLDIGGETTEVSLITGGLLWSSASFPLGCNTLLRAVASQLATTPSEARAALALSQEGRHAPAAGGRVASAAAEATASWLAACREGVASALGEHFLPQRICLIGDTALMPLFRDKLASADWHELMVSNSRPELYILNQEILANFCEITSGNPHDISLMIEAIFCGGIMSA